VIRRKRQFDEPIVSDDTKSLEELFRIDYFLYMVDQVVSSIQIRFEQFQEYDKNFGFLFTFDKLKLLDENVLKTCCLNLENILKHEESSDIDGLDLFSELKILRVVFRERTNDPIEILDYIKKVDSFLNACIAYRILLTIPVTVASAERIFSKLKLIKTYLRSTMSQERLSGLVMLSIEKDLLEKLEYNDLINTFASQKARKVKF